MFFFNLLNIKEGKSNKKVSLKHIFTISLKSLAFSLNFVYTSIKELRQFKLTLEHCLVIEATDGLYLLIKINTYSYGLHYVE